MAYLAIDLGAGSGRVIKGTISQGRLSLEEVHRFGNEPVMVNGVLRWNFDALMSDIRKGIAMAGHVDGIGVDTWGVDFGLLDEDGGLISAPVCYRDERTRGMAAEVEQNVIGAKELYEFITGIQQMEINTLYQLRALWLTNNGELAKARRMLFMPDLINYMLTGAAVNEYTIASTSQLLNASRKEWARKLIGALGLDVDLFSTIVQPGTVIGHTENGVKVFAVGSHDTASAIAAIPAQGDDWAFLSSGTWSLLGVPLAEPILTDAARRADFTNEGGVDGKILFMRNITGLWLLQRLVAEWGHPPYEELVAAGREAQSRGIVDVDDPSFNNPASMSDAIRNFCARTAQAAPDTRGEFVRCVMESLAEKYRLVGSEIAQCTGRAIRRLYIVGGGSRNEVLNQLIARAMGVEVVVGLAEGTAAGNIMQQAIADGTVADWHEAHRIIRNSFEWKTYK